MARPFDYESGGLRARHQFRLLSGRGGNAPEFIRGLERFPVPNRLLRTFYANLHALLGAPEQPSLLGEEGVARRSRKRRTLASGAA